jgi:AcrR family transcriptional regulator
VRRRSDRPGGGLPRPLLCASWTVRCIGAYCETLAFRKQNPQIPVMRRRRIVKKCASPPRVANERTPEALGAVRRGRPRSDAANVAILEASIALVRESGYDALTMEGIAARAGVGKATVYRRWVGKEALVAEAIQQLMSDAMRVPDTGSTTGDVRTLMHVTQSMYADASTPMLLSGLVAAMARSASIADAVRSSFVARWRDAMRAVLVRGMTRGEIHPATDLELALDLLSGPPFHRMLIGGRPIDDAFMRGVVDVILRGLAPATR